MLCQKCHKNLATVRYAEVVDGQVTDQHLCAECLAKYQQNAATGFELSTLTPGVHRASAETVVRESAKAQKVCPSCGMPLNTIIEKARVGCPACFSHFGGQIESTLEGLHRGLQHLGKSGRMDDARARLRADLQTKRALLRSVLRAENYEEAARLRDEIQSLETGLNMAESGAD
jgi:protein arginine kinase activator